MGIHPLAFYLFGGLAVAFAFLVILKKNPVASAFSLIMVFFCMAGLYASMSAHLIAALQVLVYAGAIMVLFVFVIMLLAADEPSFDMRRSHPVLMAFAGAFCLALFGFFVWAHQKSDAIIAKTPGSFTLDAINATGGNSKVVSQLMFSKYLLPFEITSILLLAVIVGTVAVAKRKHVGPRDVALRAKASRPNTGQPEAARS